MFPNSSKSLVADFSGEKIKQQNKKLNIAPAPAREARSQPLTVAQGVVKMLENLGVQYAFGVSGGAIAPIWASLEKSSIGVFHFRHESGAAFAAVESHFASDRPVAVFATTGPGITNILTGLFAARWEGAKVIFLSPSTSAPQRGRWACQETSAYTTPIGDLFTSGKLFHYATSLESAEELPEVYRRLTLGLTRPGGFVANLNIATAIQSSLLKAPLPQANFLGAMATASEMAIARCAELLSSDSFAIWVGFGARKAAKEIRQLAEVTGAAVMSSARGKGIFPEDHPQFVGVTGFGGHASVLAYMQVQRPQRILVLGTRLGEFTSFWSPAMVPEQGFIHVDIDPEVPGVAYPEAKTFSIQSDVGAFVKALLKHFPNSRDREMAVTLPQDECTAIEPRLQGPVRPEVLMEAIQEVVVEGSDALVMAEPGNSFAWAIHQLRFSESGRYRTSTGFGSMGHFVVGVVGAAVGSDRKVVAIVGDGAMLMNSEVSTAVKYRIPAIWIVLNDASYNMCEQGMALLGFEGVDTKIPQADFVAIARGMGADGTRVTREFDLKSALEKAMASTGPFVIDVIIDASRPAPIGSRIKSLISQGSTEFKGALSPCNQ
ncbi:MAG: thiamine pyrophosphate-binding protein [Oscillatoria sp. SIO1A7]|nr:thiamine pyrophosphate-binding protein [Oscillatoria sp. SIO1A7]